MNLDAKLDAIARKHGVVEDNDKHEKHPVTPVPKHPKCTNNCGGVQLIKGLCEPCYRNLYIVPIIEDRDALLRQLSNRSLMIASHEAELKNSKMAYNKALEQNWSCKHCHKVFDYYGHLFEHEKDCKPVRTPKTPADRRASRLSKRVVV